MLGGLRLLTRESGTSATAGLPIGEVVAKCAESGAGQILAVIDTCFSAAGIASAGEVAEAVMAVSPPNADRLWVGVLASSSADASAYDGVLGTRLRQLLRRGPRDAQLQLRWSRHSEAIRGDDLCDAVVKDWDTHVQHPDFQGRGNAWFMFPNPLFDSGAPAQVVEHLLAAARGGASVAEQSAFTGRGEEVDLVVGWVRSDVPGLHVVTGSAGTGKSAVVGRVVSLAVPSERERLLGEGRELWHADPGEGSVHAHVYARALTADRTAQLIDAWLIRNPPGILVPAPEGRRNAAELLGALQRRAEAAQALGSAPAVPVIVVDGLDEARAEAFGIAEPLLGLARFATVIVSTREMKGPDTTPSLLHLLAPEGVGVDLDDPQVRARGVRALHAYVLHRLEGSDPGMDAGLVADLLADRASGGGNRPFLLARLVTDQLLTRPVATDRPGWQALVSGSIEKAFDADLAQVPSPPHHADTADGEGGRLLARRMLTALTWAYGAGFPEDEWICVAAALGAPGEPDVDRDDASWVLDELGRYILQDGEDGTAVYRVAHASLAEHLRPAYRATAAVPFDPAAGAVTAALLDRYATMLAAGIPAPAPGYLWRYAWRHAADAGPGGLDLLRGLADTASALRPDVAMAALQFGEVFYYWGRLMEAVTPTEEAVTGYRALAADNPAHLPNLAMALTNLGACYGEVGRRAEALAPTEEAVTGYRALAADNPAHLPDLAMALGNLGVRYSEVGRRAEAVTPTEEAVTTYRALAADNPAHLPDLAAALNNLGNRYSEVGRRAEALAPTEEAVTTYRALAADNPAHLPDLAMALNNLGIRYSEVGRRAEALAPTEEAVTGYRALAADNPAHLPDLAMALNNLGACYSGVGRRAEAVAPIAL